MSSLRNLLHDSSLTIKSMHYKSSATAAKSKFPDRMAASAPVAVGTRGTIGSLVKKEIEYFTKIELDKRGTSQKPQPHFVDMVSGRGYSMPKPSFWVLLTTGKRRKRRNTNGFLPRMCSVAEEAESNQMNKIPGYSYRILKNDINNLQL